MALAHSSHRKLPTARFLHLGLVRQINPYKTRSLIYYYLTLFKLWYLNLHQNRIIIIPS
jgi:hypothetical protein